MDKLSSENVCFGHKTTGFGPSSAVAFKPVTVICLVGCKAQRKRRRNVLKCTEEI